MDITLTELLDALRHKMTAEGMPATEGYQLYVVEPDGLPPVGPQEFADRFERMKANRPPWVDVVCCGSRDGKMLVKFVVSKDSLPPGRSPSYNLTRRAWTVFDPDDELL